MNDLGYANSLSILREMIFEPGVRVVCVITTLRYVNSLYMLFRDINDRPPQWCNNNKKTHKPIYLSTFAVTFP